MRFSHRLIEELGRILGHQAKGDRRRTGSPKPESTASTTDQRQLDLARQQIDAQLEYNLAALQSRGAAVGKIMTSPAPSWLRPTSRRRRVTAR